MEGVGLRDKELVSEWKRVCVCGEGGAISKCSALHSTWERWAVSHTYFWSGRSDIIRVLRIEAENPRGCYLWNVIMSKGKISCASGPETRTDLHSQWYHHFWCNCCTQFEQNFQDTWRLHTIDYNNNVHLKARKLSLPAICIGAYESRAVNMMSWFLEFSRTYHHD